MRCADCGHWAESFAVDGGPWGPVDVCPECGGGETAIDDEQWELRVLRRLFARVADGSPDEVNLAVRQAVEAMKG